MLSLVSGLDEPGRAAFHDFAGELAFLDTSYDPRGLAELSAVTMAVMSGRPDLVI